MMRYYRYGRGEKNYIAFLDDRLRVEEETDYLQRIETMPDNYGGKWYFEKPRSFGTLTYSLLRRRMRCGRWPRAI
jgi:hypothetical protein